MYVCHSGQPKQVDIHAVALFFFAQLYLRQAQRPDTMDIWPSQASQDEKAFNSQLMPAHQQGQTQPHQPHHSPLQNGGQPGQQEPVSPARSNSSRSSAGSQGSPGKHYSHCNLMDGPRHGLFSTAQPVYNNRSNVFVVESTVTMTHNLQGGCCNVANAMTSCQPGLKTILLTHSAMCASVLLQHGLTTMVCCSPLPVPAIAQQPSSQEGAAAAPLPASTAATWIHRLRAAAQSSAVDAGC